MVDAEGTEFGSSRWTRSGTSSGRQGLGCAASRRAGRCGRERSPWRALRDPLVDQVLDELRVDGDKIVEAKTLDSSGSYERLTATRTFGRFVGSSSSLPSPRSPAGSPATRQPSWPPR